MADGLADAVDPGPTDPEEQWLTERVAIIESAWTDASVALETLRVEMDNFALVHHQRLGPMYGRLDELDALIAEAVAARSGRPEDIRRAYEARSKVEPMPDLDELFAARDAAAAAGGAGEDMPPPRLSEPMRRVRPSKEAQRLYRELARRAHPDLARDAGDQERRSAFITRVNAAYAEGDLAALEELAAEWHADPVTAPGAGTPDRIAWLRARLEWLASRIEGLAEERDELRRNPIGQLLELSPEDPEAVLEQLAEQLLAEVEQKQRQLDGLVGA
ncbi:hypothetical protein [Phaeacidiphilus oryzae]|uniref:hypothetical protein n=1 Tax=Phaeacidiphilus oryzae TaxID=348818 RepID=UPI000566E90A|nr:hypothetical protein [Phaeacidiphilus oryzae]